MAPKAKPPTKVAPPKLAKSRTAVKQPDTSKSAKKPKEVKKVKAPPKNRRFNALFQARPKNFGIGQDLPPKDTDLTRLVRWPHYIRRQRQKRVLQKRLRVPPAVHQFTLTVDRHTKKELFKFAAKYKPESKIQKKRRLMKIAQAKLLNKETKHVAKPIALAAGAQRVTRLIQQKRAKLVFIAHDVDPLELVLCLPTLCKKQGVPYCIVKGKAALGRLVGFKNCSTVAFTEIKDEDKATFKKLLESVNIVFSEKYEEARKTWGGLNLSRKSRDKLKKKEKLAAENRRKLGKSAEPEKKKAKKSKVEDDDEE
eukprot:NODE_2836_length_1109_cov_1015.131132_g2600_i0.p1 GENE.NODE_2836_length_1109_cov_1015.131132_g2600_i0~~NODE_2836_length_1109_cov_1015.131132_g2600_i0.p1  ORF type:complete len:310 (-),score=80.94 NODE_2836_length_1109_cov_1015.131132_g2600_i0:111-1040(-)